MNLSNLQNKRSIKSQVNFIMAVFACITLFVWHHNRAAYNVNYVMN